MKSQLARAQREAEGYLREIGPSVCIERLMRRYDRVNTRVAYAQALALYFRWLKGKGVKSTPDELIQDNLNCYFKSDPTDVRTKRKHVDPIDEYVNV